MGESQNPHFDDFGFLRRVTKPKNQLCLSLETPGYLTKIKKNPWNIFKTLIFENIFLEIHSFENNQKDRRRKSRRSVY